MHRYITIDDIREEIQDRTPDDNVIDCDLSFSDDEIVHAMERAAAAYNSVPPLGVDVVSGKRLPLHNDIFMYATLSKLYNSATFKLARNMASWQTGETTVDLKKSRMEAYKSLVKEFDDMWKPAAAARKAELNRAQCWGNW